tara:strand:- start:5416 stop:5667 length:252 start_codon:yes stop_codon:yes gene_type:complete
MKINLQITYDGGVAKEITANAADMVAFETKFNIPVSNLSSDPRMSYLFFLGYSAEKRTGATKETFEKWLETVELVGAGETDPK